MMSQMFRPLIKTDWSQPQSSAAARLEGWRGYWESGDVPWLRDQPIQARFNLLMGIAVLVGVIVGTAYLIGEFRISSAIEAQSQFQRLADNAGTVRAGSLAMQTATSALIGERKRVSIDEFKQQSAAVHHAIDTIAASSFGEAHHDEVADLAQSFTAIDERFAAVAAVTERLGLTENEGLRGKLNASVKAFEDELQMWPNTDDLRSRMLRMRSAEKDFILYQSDSHLSRNRKYASEFDLGIDAAQLAPSTKDDFRKLLEVYSEDMATYAAAVLESQREIGKLREQFLAVQPRIDSLAETARAGMAEATKDQNATRTQVFVVTLLVGGLGYAVFLVFGMVSGRSIARPVVAMERAMNELAAGQDHIDIPGVHRADEVGLMAKAVRVFRDNAISMGILKAEQEQQHAARDRRAKALDGLIIRFDTEVSEIVHDVAGSSVELQRTAGEMREFITETIEQMKAVDEASCQSSASVQNMAAASEELAYSTEEIAGRVNQAAQLASAAAEAASRTNAIVGGLSEVTQRIGNVVGFIQTIANQTHMLALNATIEASRAGEHGHGFAVVAGEVKQLATQTSSATGEIAQQISAVQTAGRDAVIAIQEIVAAVDDVHNIAAAIAASVGEQGTATREIARSAQNAAQGTTVVSTSITWVVNEAGGSLDAAHAMLEATSRTAQSAEAMRRKVDGFLTQVRQL